MEPKAPVFHWFGVKATPTEIERAAARVCFEGADMTELRDAFNALPGRPEAMTCGHVNGVVQRGGSVVCIDCGDSVLEPRPGEVTPDERAARAQRRERATGEAPAITGSREGDGPVRGGGTTPQTAATTSPDNASVAGWLGLADHVCEGAEGGDLEDQLASATGDRAPALGVPDPETCSHRWSSQDGFKRCVDCGSETLNPKHGLEVQAVPRPSAAQRATAAAAALIDDDGLPLARVCPFGHVAGCPQFGFELACGRAECLAVDPLPLPARATRPSDDGTYVAVGSPLKFKLSKGDAEELAAFCEPDSDSSGSADAVVLPSLADVERATEQVTLLVAVANAVVEAMPFIEEHLSGKKVQAIRDALDAVAEFTRKDLGGPALDGMPDGAPFADVARGGSLPHHASGDRHTSSRAEAPESPGLSTDTKGQAAR